MASNGKKGSGNAAPTQNEQKKQTAEKKNSEHSVLPNEIINLSFHSVIHLQAFFRVQHCARHCITQE